MTRFATYHFMNDHKADIGEIVCNDIINCFNEFIHCFGENSFFKMIYEGEGGDVCMAYLHPCDEMRVTDNFSLIQKAFFNAYV